MVEYSVYDNQLVLDLSIEVVLRDEYWEQCQNIYRAERKKYIEKKLAQPDAAISKVDSLVEKLKTAQKFINNLTNK